jgi:alkylhydroperoxidase family enzyme
VPTHIALGRSVGLDEAKLQATGDEGATDALSPVERVVVDYSRRLTRTEPSDDGLFTALREHFTLQQLMELCFTIGIAGIINRFHATFHTPLDESTRAAFERGGPIPIPAPPDDPGTGSGA